MHSIPKEAILKAPKDVPKLAENSSTLSIRDPIPDGKSDHDDQEAKEEAQEQAVIENSIEKIETEQNETDSESTEKKPDDSCDETPKISNEKEQEEDAQPSSSDSSETQEEPEIKVKTVELTYQDDNESKEASAESESKQQSDEAPAETEPPKRPAFKTFEEEVEDDSFSESIQNPTATTVPPVRRTFSQEVGDTDDDDFGDFNDVPEKADPVPASPDKSADDDFGDFDQVRAEDQEEHDVGVAVPPLTLDDDDGEDGGDDEFGDFDSATENKAIGDLGDSFASASGWASLSPTSSPRGQLDQILIGVRIRMTKPDPITYFKINLIAPAQIVGCDFYPVFGPET